jgi:hypothetical protein
MSRGVEGDVGGRACLRAGEWMEEHGGERNR